MQQRVVFVEFPIDTTELVQPYGVRFVDSMASIFVGVPFPWLFDDEYTVPGSVGLGEAGGALASSEGSEQVLQRRARESVQARTTWKTGRSEAESSRGWQ